MLTWVPASEWSCFRALVSITTGLVGAGHKHRLRAPLGRERQRGTPGILTEEKQFISAPNKELGAKKERWRKMARCVWRDLSCEDRGK